MGEVIALAERRADRSRRSGRAETAFFYDLACPFSYLAAERVERLLGAAAWVPVKSLAWQTSRREVIELRARAERRAAELRLPLVWPDRFPSPVPGALRAAVRAGEVGAGARFGLAAARLAFCGGFDLEDPEVLAEAAAAAGLPLDDCLAAAGDRSLDEMIEATARGLAARGVTELPAMRSGRRFQMGERGLTETAALLRARPVYVRPLAPVG
jgi:2-hydroxychromene-2-carboxylate isomerase